MTFGSEFWSLVGGAVLGGTIAAAIQLIPLKESRRQRAQDQEEARKALGHAMLFKMIKIYSNVRWFQNYLTEASNFADKHEPKLEPWQSVRAAANCPDRIHFKTDEMALILSFNDDELFNGMMLIDENHNSLVGTFSLFCSKRQSLMQMMPADMEGEMAKIELTEKALRIVRPRMVELNLLVGEITKMVEQDVGDSFRILQGLHKGLTKRLGFTKKLEFPDSQ